MSSNEANKNRSCFENNPDNNSELIATNIENIQVISYSIDGRAIKLNVMCNGQISGLSGASHILGISSTTLHSKTKKFGIVKKHSGLNN